MSFWCCNMFCMIHGTGTGGATRIEQRVPAGFRPRTRVVNLVMVDSSMGMW